MAVVFANRLIRKMFESRGLTEKDVSDINLSDHGELLGTQDFIDNVSRWARDGVPITILPDFDMDGIMSGVTFYAGLAEIGCDVELFMPSIDNYSLTNGDIDRLMKEHPRTGVIMTCDVGVNDKSVLQYAHTRYGVEIAVTDHHQEDENESSRDVAVVFVDPCRVDETYHLPGICGAHVAYQLLYSYAYAYELSTGDGHYVDQIARLQVFAGIGTISDSMPLLYENRQVVKEAIAICRLVWKVGNTWFIDEISGRDKYRRVFYGLHHICEAFAKVDKLKSVEDITEEFFGFYLAPAFNAVKRMNGDISRAFNVFIGTHQRVDCLYLLDLNEQRKAEVDKWWKALLDGQNAYAPYAYITPAPSGLRGLLAMKVMQQTRLPSLVLGSNGYGGYAGSGRSPLWYPFLTRTRGRVHANGHEGAFGIGVTNQKELTDIVDFVAEDSAQILAETPEVTETHYDFVIATDGTGDVGIDVPLFKEFYDALEQFKPFGQSFEQPYILLKFDMERDEVFVKTMGKQKEHLKLLLPYGFSVVCWNQGHIANKLHGEVRVEGIIEENVWNDIVGMQFKGSVIECSEQ